MHSSPTEQELNSPAMQRRINALRRTDNVTNWFYLASAYLFLGSVIGLTIAFYHYQAAWGLCRGWSVPVTFLAIVLIGVGQHRLITLAHEASHYILFRNRLLNELASDWLCMFPMISVTHNYRLQHLAHHQWVNDPERDPDLHFMQASGHEVHFPIPRWRFLWECVIKQFLWVPGLVGYMLIRARHVSAGGSGPYQSQGRRSRLPLAVGGVHLFATLVLTNVLAWWGQPWLLGLVPLGMLLAVLAFYALIPERLYPHSKVKPDVPPRWWSVSRIAYTSVLFMALGWLSYLTGAYCGLYYLLLWVVPLLTTFPFLMILREILQHGDLGQERFRHTRLIQGNWLTRFAVFPLGMDHHLPHHLFPMVPHYRLKQLHALLKESRAYREETMVVGSDGQMVTAAPARPAVGPFLVPGARMSEARAEVAKNG